MRFPRSKIIFYICTLSLFLFICGLSDFLFAQGNTYHFNFIGLDQGLPSSTVKDITQDRHGFIWIATEDGLCKFDGYRMTVYRHNPDDSTSLRHNNVYALLADSRDMLWIGLWGDGREIFDEVSNSFRFEKFPIITDYLEDMDSNVWFSTYNNGIYKFIRRSGEYEIMKHSDENPGSLTNDLVFAIGSEKNGTVWVGYRNGGVSRYNAEKNEFTHYKNKPGDTSSLSHNTVEVIHTDSYGNVWIGTLGGGLNRYNKNTDSFIHYKYNPDNPSSISDNRIFCILEDKAGTLWIGTSRGLNIYNLESESFTRIFSDPGDPKSIKGNSVNCIFESDDGVLWFGTNDGINTFDRTTQNFNHFKIKSRNTGDMGDFDVRAIYEDPEQNLWIGTDGAGMFKYNWNTDKYDHYVKKPDNPKSISNNHIRCIYEDSKGFLWIGTYYEGTLNRFNKRTGEVIKFRHDPDDSTSISRNTGIWSILEDEDGILWIGTRGGGLNKYDRETGRFSSFRKENKFVNSNFVLTLHIDKNGFLWFGTYGGGVNRFDRKTGKAVYYDRKKNDPFSISSAIVYSIFEDERGFLWFGTREGLNKFDPETKKFTSYRENKGLPSEIIWGVFGGGRKNLWLSTNNGISKFDPVNEVFTHYSGDNGLQSKQFSQGAFFQHKSGKIYFGGPKGINIFYPDSIKESSFTPPVVITDLLLFNRPVSVSDTTVLSRHINLTEDITLDHKDYIFAFEFSALSYRQPYKNRFAYKLEGLNPDWIKTGYRNRRAVFTNLAHGEYVFKVKASNNDGTWNETGKSIKIIILPPFWKTLWFRTIIILLFAGGIFSVVYWRINDLRNRNIELKDKVKTHTGKLEKKSDELENKVNELKKSILHISRLEGLLPICCNCKKIRLEEEESSAHPDWIQIEKYISDRTGADFSHGICPDCMKELYPDIYSDDDK